MLRQQRINHGPPLSRHAFPLLIPTRCQGANDLEGCRSRDGAAWRNELKISVGIFRCCAYNPLRTQMSQGRTRPRWFSASTDCAQHDHDLDPMLHPKRGISDFCTLSRCAQPNPSLRSRKSKHHGVLLPSRALAMFPRLPLDPACTQNTKVAVL